MPIAMFVTMLVAFVILGAVQTGLLLWVSARCVRLKDLTVKRAVGWALVMAGVQVAVFLLTSELGSVVMEWSVGLVSLVLVVLTAILIRRASTCGKGRAIGAAALWMVLVVPVSMAEGAALRQTVAEAFRQVGQSMAPTFRDDDRFIIDRTMQPGRFDIIVFTPPHDPSNVHVSRLIGLPGETVEIIDGRVHIDGQMVPVPVGVPDIYYKSDFPSRPGAVGIAGNPIRLGADKYFVLSDNTANSLDSRFWSQAQGVQAGALAQDDLIGVVRLMYSPLSRVRIFP